MRRLTWGIAVVVVLAAAWFAAHSLQAPSDTKGKSASSGIPVLVDTVKLRDIPVELRGLGTVQAFNTVTAKPRVGGQIMEIAFTEGQRVKPGTVLAKIDARPFTAQLHQAQAAKAKDEADLENLKNDLARIINLVPKGFATAQSLDAQKAKIAGAEAAIAGDSAAVENAQVQLDYTSVTAPIEGVTGIRMVDAGNVIAANDPLVVITQIEPISVIFTLPADAASALEIGQTNGTVAVTVFNRDDRIKLADGTLALIDNQIDLSTNTVRLKATFPNTDHALRPGQFVNAHLLKTVREKAVSVPKAAVQQDQQGSFTYVLGANATVELRRITPGPSSHGIVAIDEGLKAGEQVVVDGQYGLRPGDKVAPRTQTQELPADSGSALSIP